MISDKTVELSSENVCIALLMIVAIFLIGIYLGYDYGAEEKQTEMLNHFDTIKIGNSSYSLQNRPTEDGCWNMPEYNKSERR